MCADFYISISPRPSTWRYWELAVRTGYLVWGLLPATSDDADGSQSRNTAQRNEPWQRGLVGKQKRPKLIVEKPKVNLESFQELWKYVCHLILLVVD